MWFYFLLFALKWVISVNFRHMPLRLLPVLWSSWHGSNAHSQYGGPKYLARPAGKRKTIVRDKTQHDDTKDYPVNPNFNNTTQQQPNNTKITYRSSNSILWVWLSTTMCQTIVKEVMYLLRICTLCGIGDHLNDGVPGGVGCVQAVVNGSSRSLYHGSMRGHHGPTIHRHGHSLRKIWTHFRKNHSQRKLLEQWLNALELAEMPS